MPSNKSLTILGVETSCDETAVAVVRGEGGLLDPRFTILANVVASQIEIHKEWGGVVPNLAKREHIKNLPVVLREVLRKARIKNAARSIDALAVTTGPGLEPALWTGITFVQNLAREWKKPTVAANHMEGHLVSPLFEAKKSVQFPALALLVSGGHTELILVKGWLRYERLGETVDDAAGEAFDKVARMIELGYPGGPILGRLARTGNHYAFSFPRPMIHTKSYDFSFSGLKTAVLYTLRDLEKNKTPYSKNDIAASFEEAAVDVLITKTFRAAKEHEVKSILLGGGVAANERLRTRMQSGVRTSKIQACLFLPQQKYTGDNAAMIAAAAYFHALKKEFSSWKKLAARATMSL